MFKSTKVERLIAGAVAALVLLGGFAAPAWATYGGGACHSCTPAPVIATQCNVVSLCAPRSRPSTRLSTRRSTSTSPSP